VTAREKVLAGCIGALLVVAGANSSISPALGADLKPCDESTRRVYRLRAEGVGCGKAREVSRAYDRRRISTGTFPSGDGEEVRGFLCRTRSTGYEAYRVRCSRGGDLVVFIWGV
jgi:hypothetical protein